jgi:hypothetical protein
MNDKIKWLDYEFTSLKPDAPWNDVGGVYIFCGVNQKNEWQSFYIGIAQSFRERFSSHEKWDKAAKLGATHIHALVEENEERRVAIEKTLIGLWKPPLNTNHV